MEQLPVRHFAAGMWPWLTGRSPRCPGEDVMAFQRHLDEQAASGALRFPPENGMRMTMPGGMVCRVYLWKRVTPANAAVKKRGKG
jgi:hypothetical protein